MTEAEVKTFFTKYNIKFFTAKTSRLFIHLESENTVLNWVQ